jgi:hypothetical protein
VPRSDRPNCRRVVPLGRAAVLSLSLAACVPAWAQAEKAAEDPTKIATKVGLIYSDEFAVAGSLAFGPVTKVNARISESGQWALGGSYLFPFAIVTFSAGRNELDSGVTQTHYSLGGFMPITAMGLKTGRWQLFVPFGYTRNNGQITVADAELGQSMTLEASNNSGYVGLFALRPLSERLTLMGGGLFSRGSDDFSGTALGVGLSMHLSPDDTIGLSAYAIDNSFGSEAKAGISYRHEF